MTRDDEKASEPRPGAFLPLVLLVLVALVVGFLNTGLVEPYTSPRVAADDHGAFVFYDTAERTSPSEHAFLLRRTQDGVHFEKAQRSDGQLRAAAVHSEERLVGLFPDFFSVYARGRALEREWSGSATADQLGFEPGHLARRGATVFAFGTSGKDGALRVARLDGETRPTRAGWGLTTLDAKLEHAAEPPGPEVAERSDDATPSVPAPVAWTSAEDAAGEIAVLFRVQRSRSRDLRAGEPLAAAVRLARFRADERGAAFVGSEAVTLDEDLAAFAAVACPVSASTGALTTEVHVFAVKKGDDEPRIIDSVLEGTKLRKVDSIPYKKGGFFEDRPAQALAAFAQPGRTVLFAQVGGSVRVAVKQDGRWGEWGDVARMPIEALALVYFYLGALLVLGAVMVVAGLWALRQRLRRVGARDLDERTAERFVAEALGPRAPAVAAEPGARAPRPVEAESETPDPSENDAPIHDRLVAFVIDGLIVVGILWVLGSTFKIELMKPGEDPTRHFALWAWCGVAFLAYLTACEAFLGRTPGKRILGLEVKTTDGKPAPLAARLYRNLFRVEVIFIATMVQIPQVGELRLIVPAFTLAVLIATPRAQRRGDLVAGTVVQRAPDPPRSEAAPRREEEESA